MRTASDLTYLPFSIMTASHCRSVTDLTAQRRVSQPPLELKPLSSMHVFPAFHPMSVTPLLDASPLVYVKNPIRQHFFGTGHTCTNHARPFSGSLEGQVFGQDAALARSRWTCGVRDRLAQQEFDLAVDAAELLLRPGFQLLVQRRVDA